MHLATDRFDRSFNEQFLDETARGCEACLWPELSLATGSAPSAASGTLSTTKHVSPRYTGTPLNARNTRFCGFGAFHSSALMQILE